MNRLQRESSPYLLQHAGNPVDWYPWGEEAFARAKREDRPIFLSIGYSTCHWCHVMERESFEDPEVAAVLNEVFVPIKVDREERPDIDELYMTVCQLLTGQGGWPLTLFLTPDRKPFFAATYLPKQARYGMAGLLELTAQVREMWAARRAEIDGSAGEIQTALQKAAQPGLSAKVPDEGASSEACRVLAGQFDRENGGFGSAPKFPSAHILSFLLRSAARSGEAKSGAAKSGEPRSREARDMAERTLAAMRAGGLFDQVGLGFHRYATDERWRVPHYEKMLYDQALLALAYTEAWQLTQRPLYRRAAEEVFSYVLRDLASPEGAFYSAEDADSEGEEGRFYRWAREELGRLLSPAELELVGLEEGTLYLRDAERPLPEEARLRLFQARSARVRPFRDDKVLAGWNGLMIAALSRAAGAFDRPDYAEAASRSARFLQEHLRAPDGQLLRSWREGRSGVAAFAEDHAYLAWGLLELYEATFAVDFLSEAFRVADRLLEGYRDPSGGFFQSVSGVGPGGVRLQPFGDGALPSANSVALLVLLKLGAIGERPQYRQAAEQLLHRHADAVRRRPQAFTFLLSALDLYLKPAAEVVIAGAAGREDTAALARTFRRSFQPQAVLLLRPRGEAEAPILDLAPFLRPYGPAPDGQAMAYVCRNHACRLPVSDPETMLSLLKESD